jgi:vacuolar-type H+-ATPase subunit F/Vma7
MMQHDENVWLLLGLISANRFVTGSYLVNPETANDIDVVMVYDKDIDTKLYAIGCKRTNNEKYKLGGGAATIRSTWRKGDYNIIVVHDKIAESLWHAFSNIISHKDYQFIDKKDRIYLHELITKDYKFDFKG